LRDQGSCPPPRLKIEVRSKTASAIKWAGSRLAMLASC
jgi:hypothetical protein